MAHNYVSIMKRRASKEDLLSGQEAENDAHYDHHVLQKHINFMTFANDVKVISKQDGRLLTSFSEQDPEGREDLMNERAMEHAAALIRAVGNISSREPRQYLLALILELITANNDLIKTFNALPDIETGLEPITPLMRILNTETSRAGRGGDVDRVDMFSVSKASLIISHLVSDPSSAEPVEFFSWLNARIRDPHDPMIMQALKATKEVLKPMHTHERFVRDGGFRSLVNLCNSCKETQNTQQLYFAVFGLWLLSYNPKMMAEFQNLQAVHSLTELARVVVREKVIRVTFSTLTNLLNKEDFNEEMISFGLAKVLDTLSARKWKDSDLVKDMDEIADVLGEKIAALSSFEMYQTEVQGGLLSWTPVHNSTFWQENFSKFEDKNYYLIKRLIELLETNDETVLEVACYDIGEFARYHPDGRIVVSKLNGKAKLMAIMAGDHSPAVAKQALLAVQKLMVHNWETLQNTGGVASLSNKK